ncbi:hypothetical protein D3879_14910 [Pseudomonas cavernicola]|uniref:Uncharacterized protein n=1 Tax=Pseudomonas cavernicola TaxID=2320866 RepID=A0A418XEL0_9PSED|nr:hypothetical protein [Pseudomonas cavernicola]RJG10966.1 hypothetical protein D3879_14910 [Pseudomonas cavernicola]
MPFRTSDELRLAREHHLGSLRRLNDFSNSWSHADRQRGADTINNLKTQLAEIDAELLMAGAA